jgi:hypothetical protein
MLNVIMLIVIMLSVVMLSVFILNVVAPYFDRAVRYEYKTFMKLTAGVHFINILQL